MKAYKAFDQDMKCRGFQYEVGKEYTEDKVDICNSGFHACERPLDVLSYYPPSSRFCEVELDGDIQSANDDTKRAASKIKIGAEIGIKGLAKAQFEYVKSKTTFEHTDPRRATAGDCGAATAGDCGAATAGDWGAATAGDWGAATAGNKGAATAGYNGAATAGYKGAATAGNNGAATAGDCGAATAGDCGAATAGDCGAATAGDWGAATAGDWGAATAGNKGAATAGDCGAATAGDLGFALSGGTASVGENGVAVVRGEKPKAKGGIGATLVLVETNDDGNPMITKTVTVDGETIQADVYYTIVDGEIVIDGDSK